MAGEAWMVASAAATSAGAQAAEESSDVLFRIFGLEVTSVVTTTWGIMLVLVVLSILATRNMKEVPSGLQNAMEAGLEALQKFFGGIVGEAKANKYFPLFATLFIFIIFSNYSGLLPSSGHIPGLAAPTSSLSVTAALAIVVFIATHFLGIKENGLGGYCKHFIKPVAALLPLMLLEEIIHPVSLSLRLYGNIFGEETVTHEIFKLVPFLVPLALQALSILFCFIQAMVFTMLAAIYIDTATGAGH